VACPNFPPAWLTADDAPETMPDGWPGCETQSTNYYHDDIRGDCMSAAQDSGYMVLEAIGDDLHIHHIGAYYNCCLDYAVNYEINGSNITARKFDHGEPCDCLCDFNLETILYDLTAGTYTVTLIGIHGDIIGVDTVSIGSY
jgi:hypothetical protein